MDIQITPWTCGKCPPSVVERVFLRGRRVRCAVTGWLCEAGEPCHLAPEALDAIRVGVKATIQERDEQ